MPVAAVRTAVRLVISSSVWLRWRGCRQDAVAPHSSSVVAGSGRSGRSRTARSSQRRVKLRRADRRAVAASRADAEAEPGRHVLVEDQFNAHALGAAGAVGGRSAPTAAPVTARLMLLP